MAEHYRTRIAAERQRQIDVEGYTAEHDVGHAPELLDAARCYIRAADWLEQHDVNVPLGCPVDWPWDPDYWKDGTPERMREKAGALALAAIDAMAGGPDVITDPDQLGELTAETVVRDGDGWVYEKLRNQQWMSHYEEMPVSPDNITMPAVVLYRAVAS